MLTGVDLGFLYQLVVAVASAAVLFSAIGFVARRIWRRSEDRNQEIRRLLVLAAEESARAELEAAYVAPLPPQQAAEVASLPVTYPCALCYSPTTTRCARCKSVRYCSSTCQIIHWRQGHKEECQPFIPGYPSNDSGEAPSQKLFNQVNVIYGNDRENEEQEYGQSSPEESPRSVSDFHHEAFGGDDRSKVEHFFDETGEDSNLCETERSVKQTNILPVKLKTSHVRNMEQNGVTCSDQSNEIKSDCISSTTSSSGSSVDGSNDSSISEPSTPSSGFWDGTMKSRTKVDACADSSLPTFSDAKDADMQSFRKNIENLSRKNIPHVDGLKFSPKMIIPDDAHSPNVATKKPIHMAVLEEEKSKNASDCKGLPLLGSEESDCLVTRSSTIATTNPSPSSRRYSVGAYPSKSSRLLSSSPVKLNDVVGDMRSNFHPPESEGGNLTTCASVAHMSTTVTSAHQGATLLTDAIGASFDYGSHSPKARNGLKTSTCKEVDQLKVSKLSSPHPSTVGSEIAGIGRYANKGLFSYDMFVKLYNWNKIEMRPSGLVNCGNSCYANAVLQCLACTPPLTAYLLQGFHSKACEKKEWCFTCELESLILKVREGVSPVSPIAILSQLQKIGSRLGNGREEDAHEFLRYSVENMQSACLKEARVSAPNALEEETTLISLTFGGYLRSKIKCMRCGGKSERHERMMDLSVEIEGDIGTLEAALRKFTGTEVLDGENKYKCGRCKSYEKAKKKLKVQEAPNVLTIALKRFQSGKFGKLNKSIQFPEILDLAPYMSGTSDKSPIYKLYGVVVHLDVMNATFSGHYVCYVKNLQNKWFKVDDSVVIPVERENVLSKRAYLLLYARCSPRAPRSLRNSMIPPDSRKLKNPLSKLRSFSAGPWDDQPNRHTGIECLYPNHSNFQNNRRILEDDSSSENSSSLFSEVCSCSTESSNRDSSITDDFSDHAFGDTDQSWNNMWKHSSDSDSSSSSSSSSPSPSPLYGKRSPLSESGRYSSGNPETSGQQAQNWRPDKNGDSFWGRSVPSLNSSCTSKQCRKVDSSISSSCRETDSNSLGWANTLGNDKSGLSLRRSTRERRD